VTARLGVLAARNALDFGERPDPARGIFETILVQDGVAPLLDQHLARLRSSARALYGVSPGVDSLPGELPAGRWRMRITFTPPGTIDLDLGPRPPDPRYSVIAPFVLPGGLGPHKWADRTLLDALTVAAGAGALPVILDADHSVLEASWANILIEERGRLISPPDDGRALPGIGRGRFSYSEEPVGLDRLLAADAVVVCSALRVVRVAQ
jgi:para-aminobenzoate synthetase/4-amino-4-deoxychorismate lyase